VFRRRCPVDPEGRCSICWNAGQIASQQHDDSSARRAQDRAWRPPLISETAVRQSAAGKRASPAKP